VKEDLLELKIVDLWRLRVDRARNLGEFDIRSWRRRCRRSCCANWS